MEWLLIAWVGAYMHGGPLMQRFAYKHECEQMAMTLSEVSRHEIVNENIYRWRCVQVASLRR